jgi:glycosyltransferase involved in cell wall biosynthesis
MRLVLRSGFDRFSGYGNDAVDIAVNLARLGVEVTPWPTSVMPGLPREFCRLLERDPVGPKDVLLCFADPASMRPWEMAGMAPKMVGYTMWERTPIRREDLPWGRRTRRWSAHGMDGLAVTCEMNVGAFAALDPQIPKLVVPCGIEPGDWPRKPLDRVLVNGDRPVRFLACGVLNGRKDPFRLLGAWRDMMASWPGLRAELVMHSYSAGLHPKLAEAYGPGIVMSQRPLSRGEMWRLYADCDVLVSVSRGEGNNKPALEFMAVGGTVAASDWSGHQNWLNESTTPLPGELVPADGAPGAVEFAVDHDSLVKTLYELATDPVAVAYRGQACSDWVRSHLTWRRTLRPLVAWMESL